MVCVMSGVLANFVVGAVVLIVAACGGAANREVEHELIDALNER